ncbi:MAG: hypothetical protein ABIR58_00485 [Gemmatimonadaceae bacterium]
MARIVLGAYMVRYPLGGVLSSSLQWIVGLQQLGHEIYVAEKSGYADSCYDPSLDVMSDDCAFGTSALNELLARFGLQDNWCYAAADGVYHGMSCKRIEEVFRTADMFIDRGSHGAWLPEAEHSGLRVLIDGEPGKTQMKMANRLAAGELLPTYDAYFTVGRNVGTTLSTAPTAGCAWRPLFHPVVVDLYPQTGAPSPDAPFSTVMNWQSHEPVLFDGTTYGQKDVEFEKFAGLPSLTSAQVELALAGAAAPVTRLRELGWSVRDAHEVTKTFDSYRTYIQKSRGEFSICKHVFAAANTGWFSDRSAAYLASGRPVVMEETGFSSHLPCGEGLFAFRTVEEAASSIGEIMSDYPRHSTAAHAIASEYLDARVVIGDLLRDLGI